MFKTIYLSPESGQLYTHKMKENFRKLFLKIANFIESSADIISPLYHQLKKSSEQFRYLQKSYNNPISRLENASLAHKD